MEKLKRNRMLKAVFICSFLCMNINLIFAQELDKDYIPLKSSGRLPDVFFKSPRAEFEAEVLKLGNETDIEAKKEFLESNNYFLHNFLMSGEVLVNDSITAYVNKVANHIIQKNPSLASFDFQIFVTKSSEVNAYAFDKGYIFVNIGLLSQLENEAQLAYILAHEMIHIRKKHSVTKYIVNEKYNNETYYTEYTKEDRALAKYRFSKDQEREADIEGLELVKNTNYSIKSVMSAFDVMQYSYLPFELPEFKMTFFEDDFLKIPDTLNLKKTAGIKTNDDYDDSKSSHPNIRKRRLSIEDDVKAIPEIGRKKYLVSEEEFKKVREISRFELCRIYLLKRDYVNAIYAAYILLQKHPDNVYLKKIVSKGLYNVLSSKTVRKSSSKIYIGENSRDNIEGYEKIEGPSQRLHYFLEEAEAKELNVIALSYAYKAHKQFPNDEILSSLTDSLFSYMINVSKLYPDNFSKRTYKDILADTAKPAVNEPTEEPEEESKYTQIKINLQENSREEIDSHFIKYAFVGLLNDEEFMKRFRKASKGNSREAVDEYVSVKKNRRNEDNNLDVNKYLGISKVIFLDPFYQRAEETANSVKIKYKESEEQRAKLIEIQKSCAAKLGLGYETISTRDLTPNDVERYNENSVINEWLEERSRQGTNGDELIECSEAIKEIIQRKGCKYIALSGLYNINGRKSAYMFLLLDLETGKVIQFETRGARARDSKDLLTSYVYNSLLHVAKSAKNK